MPELGNEGIAVGILPGQAWLAISGVRTNLAEPVPDGRGDDLGAGVGADEGGWPARLFSSLPDVHMIKRSLCNIVSQLCQLFSLP